MVYVKAYYDIEFTPELVQEQLEFIFGSDLDFYEEFILPMSDEEQLEFFWDNPEFMAEYPVNYDKIHLLKDSLHRAILRMITGERR